MVTPRGRTFCYLGMEVPSNELIWQNSILTSDHSLVDYADVAELKKQVLASGHCKTELV
ncbi:hypothetical protein [uncultured Sulfitobacter sp.]|uniref:hypothetical protein n=1 Tax=uncultured Sulfitobacter sp. TaxID=191468 RepID=UPI00260CBDD3|nr:hypothetical protein [uncultured Sulfitobacter sp.]